MLAGGGVGAGGRGASNDETSSSDPLVACRQDGFATAMLGEEDEASCSNFDRKLLTAGGIVSISKGSMVVVVVVVVVHERGPSVGAEVVSIRQWENQDVEKYAC